MRKIIFAVLFAFASILAKELALIYQAFICASSR